MAIFADAIWRSKYTAAISDDATEFSTNCLLAGETSEHAEPTAAGSHFSSGNAGSSHTESIRLSTRTSIVLMALSDRTLTRPRTGPDRN